jgi:hypothetical protein|nr:MAG TPA: hypothetical protein [Caudoviricetes sp.]
MDRKDRHTLKSYFQKGDVPTEEQFAELIDSVPNIVDDGEAVRTEDGWALYPRKGGKMGVSLHEAAGDPAAWKLTLTSDKGLAIKNEAGEALLELKQDKNIVLHASVQQEGGGDEPEPDPQDYLVIEADKKWATLKEITDIKESSRVYTVMALYRDREFGICKLTRAIAICLNNVEQWVESPRKHWWGWSGYIRLRWQADRDKTYLQIRSTSNSYSGKIYCRVTENFKK